MEIFTENKKLENMQKFTNYKVQFKRLEMSIKYNFYLEAIFIEYAIMEDRTESILKHCGKYDSYIKKLNGRFPTIDSKIKYIKKLAEPKKELLHKYFANDLLDNIILWKEDRNKLIHALLKQSLSKESLKNLSETGYELIKLLRNKVNLFNRAYLKQINRDCDK